MAEDFLKMYFQQYETTYKMFLCKYHFLYVYSVRKLLLLLLLFFFFFFTPCEFFPPVVAGGLSLDS